MEMADWTGILLVFGVAVSVFLIKFLIIKCYLLHCRGETRRGMADLEGRTRRHDSIFIGPSMSLLLVSDPQLYFHNSESSFRSSHPSEPSRRLGRSRKPPPKFEKALKCSSPISYIEPMDDGPPPSYEEYLAMTSGPAVCGTHKSFAQPSREMPGTHVINMNVNCSQIVGRAGGASSSTVPSRAGETEVRIHPSNIMTKSTSISTDPVKYLTD